jgi:hypothetical protein
MTRKTRKYLELALPLIGSFLVFTAILTVRGQIMQILVAILGILLIESGILKLSQAFLPNERTYKALRSEVDYFIVLVRRLNAAALGLKEVDNEATRTAYAAIQQRMRESQDRITQLAGKTDAEVEALNLTVAADTEE